MTTKKKVKVKTVKKPKKNWLARRLESKKVVKKKPKKKKEQAIVKVEPAKKAAPLMPVTDKMLSDYLFGTNTKLTNEQKTMFFQISKANRLNPFKKEVYPVLFEEKIPVNGKYVSAEPKKYRLAVITGYEVYLKRAERSGMLSGWSAVTEGIGDSATATVTIHRKDWNLPLIHSVEMKEFNKYTATWKKMPKFMLKKVAICQGFRLAFPVECSGLPYVVEELKNVTETDADYIPEEIKQIEPGKVEVTKPSKYKIPADINPDSICNLGPYKKKPKKYSSIPLDNLLMLHKKAENPEELTPVLRYIVDDKILNACKLKGIDADGLQKIVLAKFKKRTLLDLNLEKKLTVLKHIVNLKDKEKKK